MATNWNNILSNTQSLADVLALQKKILALIGDLATLDSSEVIARIDQIIDSSVGEFDEKQIIILRDFQRAIDAAAAAGAGANGWISSLVIDSKTGLNQEQINDRNADLLHNILDYQQDGDVNFTEAFQRIAKKIIQDKRGGFISSIQ